MANRHPERTQPMRRCIACMTSRPQSELIRVAFREGKLTVDPAGKVPGRGVYLCPEKECIETAEKKNGFQRALRTRLPKEELDVVFTELREIVRMRSDME